MRKEQRRVEVEDQTRLPRLPQSTVASSLALPTSPTQKGQHSISKRTMPSALRCPYSSSADHSPQHVPTQVHLPRPHPTPHSHLLRLHHLQLHLRPRYRSNPDTNPRLPTVRLHLATCNPTTNRQSLPLRTRTSRLRRQHSV